jgi:hypothetical protein
MSNNGCGQLGAIQTRGTCWFYSILNGFILSEDGQKILFNRLTNFYKKLKPAEKAYFDDEFNAPCPMKNLSKTKEIYFWKFIDQYLCFMSGPRAASLQAGKSASLLGGMSLAGTLAKKNQGGKGAYPQAEIGKILDHVGFAKDYYVKYAQDPPKFHASVKRPFVVVMQDKYHKTTYMPEIPKELMTDPKYDLMCASLVIANTNANSSQLHRWHAVAGFVCNGKGYIYDSNQRKVFKCNWWNLAEFKKVTNEELGEAYPFFKGGKINVHTYAFAIFARKEFTKNIGVSCLMKYKTKTPETYAINFTDPNAGNKINSKLYNYLKPAERVALKRKWARTEHKAPVYINKATFNAIVTGAKNRNNAFDQLDTLRISGYKYTPENYNEFAKKLKERFPIKKAGSPSPKTKRANQVRGQFALMWKGMNANNRQVVRNYIASYKSPSPSPNTKAIAKFFEPAKKTMTLENAKREMNKLKTAKERANWYYSANLKLPNGNDVKLWKYIKEKNEADGKMKKLFGTPSPSKYTLANAKRNVNALNTAKARAEFYKKGTVGKGLNPTNLVELSKYIKAKNQAARNARAVKKSVAKPAPKKPSPPKTKTTLANAKRNVNALKTAKDRKHYKRTRATNMSQNNWMELGRYVDRKNYEAMQIRKAKREAKA